MASIWFLEIDTYQVFPRDEVARSVGKGENVLIPVVRNLGRNSAAALGPRMNFFLDRHYRFPRDQYACISETLVRIEIDVDFVSALIGNP